MSTNQPTEIATTPNSDQIVDDSTNQEQRPTGKNNEKTPRTSVKDKKTVRPGTLRPLTRKQEAFVKHLVNHPKDSPTKAALNTYGTEDKPVSYMSAGQIATDNLRKPQIIAELAKYSGKAEYNLMVLADKTTEYALVGGRDGAAYAGVSERVNNSILDRLHGKATQRTEVTSKAVVLNIDLSGTLDNVTSTTHNRRLQHNDTGVDVPISVDIPTTENPTTADKTGAPTPPSHGRS